MHTTGNQAPTDRRATGGAEGRAQATVDALLEASGLAVPESERRALAATYDALRAQAETLEAPWGIPGAGPGFTVSPWATPARAGGAGVVAAAERRDATADGDTDTRWAGVAQIAAALRDGTTTSTRLVEECLERIRREDAALGSVVALFDDAACAAAAAADAALAAGIDLGPLHGVAVVVKDILTTREGPTLAQSKVPTPYRDSLTDAAVVARLRRGGAVVVAKTSTSEFALGAPDPTAGFPEPRCPWDLGRWPGGSSSGTAVAVGAGLVPAGLGTDTGGSVRIPAALCGISGLKTTHAKVPTGGCVPLAPGLDTVGPLARSAMDCALVFDALTGESTAAGLDGDVDGLKVGIEVAHHCTVDGLDPAVPGRLDEVAAVLANLGARLDEVAIGDLARMRTACMVQMQSEAFAVHRELLRTRWHDYGTRTRGLLAAGALHSPADSMRALAAGRAARAVMARLFERVDVLVTPTLGTTAPGMDEDWWPRLMGLVFTTAWNLVGLPALSVPMGPGAGGLPLGVQIVGRPGDEATVLRVGDAIQRASRWHLARPPVRR